MSVTNLKVIKNFYDKAKDLRSEFETCFKNPREGHSKRFVWDYWYVENQYNLIRTPASYYFSEKVFNNFNKHMIQWGQENLGCHNISPLWMSYYVDGCFQNLHSDVPHGPWAFVYSLTPQKREFRGGETQLLKSETLDYWNSFLDQDDHEINSFVELVKPDFNQLTVFDPRIPHGVTEVKGTRDPMKARLVLHGWFVEPRPYVTGGLTTQQVQNQISDVILLLSEKINEFGQIHGTVSLRLQVNSSGEVIQYKLLTNTLRDVNSSLTQQKSAVLKVLNFLKQNFCHLKFKKTKTKSEITIPILFK